MTTGSGLFSGVRPADHGPAGRPRSAVRVLFLPLALPDDPPSAQPDRPRPHLRALTLHHPDRARAAAGPGTPAPAELAGRLHDVLTARWGDMPLKYAPAFTGEP